MTSETLANLYLLLTLNTHQSVHLPRGRGEDGSVSYSALGQEHPVREQNAGTAEDQTAQVAGTLNILTILTAFNIRVHNDSCEVHPDFQSAIRLCYAKYTEDVEDRNNFGNGVRIRTSPSAWMYKSSEELKTSNMVTPGRFGYYSGGGAVQNFHSLKNETKMIIHELKEGLWVNRATRAVFIDFTVYNANVNLFCVIKLIFEFPATGGIMPSSEFRTVKLIR